MNRVKRCRPLLGTYVEITLVGESGPAELHAWVNEAYDAITQVHRLMNFHDPHSELSCLNATAHHRPMPVHEWTHAVLRCACEVGDQSAGALNIAARSTNGGSFRDIQFHEGQCISFRRPLKLDLGGIAKGFAVDRAIEALARHAPSFACVNAGGDLRFFGEAPAYVDVRDPAAPRQGVHRLNVRRPSLATSASYFQPGPYPANVSASVFAGTCMIADALTKVVMLADENTATRVLKAYDAESVVLSAVPA